MTAMKIKPAASPVKDAIYNEWLSKKKDFPGSPKLQEEVKRIGERIENEMADPKRKGPVIGAVVGSVQSGKTASMIGLTGHLFKQGFQVVTVLAGLKDDLRYQTASRFCTDLLSYGTKVYDFELNANGNPMKNKPKVKTPISYTHPKGDGPHGTLDQGRDFFVQEPLIMDINTTTVASLYPYIRRGIPIILFVKKIARKNGGGPMGVLRTAIQQIDDDLITNDLGHLKHAIIDDESDEASVGTAKAVAPGKIIEIVNIGDAAYIGFTATPLANIFSDVNNPLKPKHFLELLKYPADYGIGLPNLDVCYNNTPQNFVKYTGGFVFHQWNDLRGENNFFREKIQQTYEHKDVHNALISYIVSGAIKVVQKGANFPTKSQLIAGKVPSSFVLPEPHSMLIHADVKTVDHFAKAGQICESVEKIWKKKGRKSPASLFETTDVADVQKAWGVSKQILIDSLKNKARMKVFENWHTEFEKSTNSVIKNSPKTPVVPPWKDVKSKLKYVIENINLRVVNHKGEENLFYDSSELKGGEKSVPDDICSIVIAGNKMGRGMTLKGLCTTVFLRTAKKPSMDVTIQRQRWFGYRGKELGLIRVFTDDVIWELLEGINLDDEGLKSEIALRRHLRPDAQEWQTFWTSSAAKLSGKIKSGSKIFFSYSPMNRGFFQYMNNPSTNKKIDDENWKNFGNLIDSWVKQGMKILPSGHYLMGQLFNGKTHKDTGKKFGNRLNLIEAAEILETFQIHGHNPDSSKGQLGILKSLGIKDAYMPKPGSPHRGKRHQCFTDFGHDPYHIAAFLRYWAKEKGKNSTKFNVVIRNAGSKKLYESKGKTQVKLSRAKPPNYFDSLFPNKSPLRKAPAWGTMNTKGHGGDGRIDDSRKWPSTMVAGEAGATNPRVSGEPGMLIFEIGEDSKGQNYLRMGIVTPEGGPDGTTIAVQ
jgi:hypothetical protein